MKLAIQSLANCKIASIDKCVILLRYTLAGLGYLYIENIIYRDIKPANILLIHDNSRHWKLLDFGISKVEEITNIFCDLSIYLASEIGEFEYSAYIKTIDI